MDNRISRDELNMRIARLIALRSTCLRARVGCVITLEGRIIVTGYNGNPSGMPHCIDVGCLIEDNHCMSAMHAEAGAISFAAREGIPLKGAVLYVTLAPCINCAKLIINAGITKVLIDKPYTSDSGIWLLQKAGVEVTYKPLGGDINE